MRLESAVPPDYKDWRRRGGIVFYPVGGVKKEAYHARAASHVYRTVLLAAGGTAARRRRLSGGGLTGNRPFRSLSTPTCSSFTPMGIEKRRSFLSSETRFLEHPKNSKRIEIDIKVMLIILLIFNTKPIL